MQGEPGRPAGVADGHAPPAFGRGGMAMSEGHNPAEAIGRVTHYYGHISVAAISLTAPLAVGDRIHILGHTTDIVQDAASLEVEHQKVERAEPGDDVALKVNDHVREHDLIFREP